MAEDQNVAKGPYANEIAEAIYQTRIKTIAELARRAGMERFALSQIVNGWRLPSAEDFDALVRETGWTPEALYPKAEYRDAIAATRKEVA